MADYLFNRKAAYDYEILDRYEAGIELLGHEVKSVRSGMGSLVGSFVSPMNGGLFVVGATITPYQPNNTPADYDSVRSRRLLLTKKEIDTLSGRKDREKLTIVPIRMYNKGRKIKLEIALVRGKKKFDKRETIKKREAEKEIRRSFKTRD